MVQRIVSALKSTLTQLSTNVWPTLVKRSLIFAPLVCLIAIEPLRLHGNSPPSVKDFHGLKLNFFHEETGRRFLKVSYQDAVSENKKLGFLTMNLALLKIKDLKIEMDANYIDSEKISSLFEKVSSQRGIRYAVAEPINLIIRSPKSIIRIEGQKGKFTADGSLRIWGSAKLVHGTLSEEFESVSITTDPSANSLLLTTGSGHNPSFSVPLSNQP